MEDNIKLSVIIPIYNLENYVSECLDSITKQVKNNVEIIIMDDGSTDKSKEICNRYCEQYDYIKYFYQENLGVSCARNNGLKKANGKYILFVDGDDWLLENSINCILHYINQDKDIILGDFIKSFKNNIEKKKNYIQNSLKQKVNTMDYPKNYINIFKNKLYNLSLCCNVIKKDLFIRNNIVIDETLKYTEDMDCMLSLILNTKKVVLLEEQPIYVYRQNREDSATSKYTTKRVLDTLYFVDKWYNKIINSEMNDEIKKYILDFVRYQYFIALGITLNLPKKERKDSIENLKKYKFLFNEALGKKEKLVRIIYRIFRFKITCILMGFWIRNKKIIKR